jgi:hypothetical protein
MGVMTVTMGGVLLLVLISACAGYVLTGWLEDKSKDTKR